MSTDLTIPSDRNQGHLRWVVCFVVVLLLHAVAVARLLAHPDFIDAPQGSQTLEFDVALGDFTPEQERIDYTPANPVREEVKPKDEPEQKDDGDRDNGDRHGDMRHEIGHAAICSPP